MTRSGNPFGLSSSTTDSHITKNTEWGAIAYLANSKYGINGKIRAGIVHRIDKDTSGLLMVAKNDKAHQALSEQLQEKTVDRKY